MTASIVGKECDTNCAVLRWSTRLSKKSEFGGGVFQNLTLLQFEGQPTEISMAIGEAVSHMRKCKSKRSLAVVEIQLENDPMLTRFSRILSTFLGRSDGSRLPLVPFAQVIDRVKQAQPEVEKAKACPLADTANRN